MGFWKKRNQENLPISERAKPYLEYRRELGELDFSSGDDFALAIYCLENDTSLVRTLDVDDDEQRNLLKQWIENIWDETGECRYLSCLQFGVDHPELLMQYIRLKLVKTDPHDKEMVLTESYDDKLVFNYQYETKRGETVAYFDQALGVPTSLVVKANIKLKLIDPQALVEKIDMSLKQIDLAIVTGFITNKLNQVVRDTLLSFITYKKLSFYDLPQHYTVINKGVMEKITDSFNDCGLSTIDFSVSDIAVTDNTDVLLRNQFFAIAEAERVKAHEQKLESAALDLYERKAAIHAKYPNFPLTLTEAEKDLALNRYLTRKGKDTALKADIKATKLATREINRLGTRTETPEVVSTKYVNNYRYGFRIFYAVLVVVLFALTLNCFINVSYQVGLQFLGCAILIAGFTAFFGYDRLRYCVRRQLVPAGEDALYEDDEEENAVGGMVDNMVGRGA